MSDTARGLLIFAVLLVIAGTVGIWIGRVTAHPSSECTTTYTYFAGGNNERRVCR